MTETRKAVHRPSRPLVWLLLLALLANLLPVFPPAARAEGSITSPQIGTRTADGAEVLFSYQGDGSESKVIVKGEFTADGWGTLIPLAKGNGDLWSVTRKIPAGWYEYGLVAGEQDWKADPLNPVRKNGNPGLSVPGISFKQPANIARGTATVLDAVYYTGVLGETEPVEWSVAPANQGVKILDSKLTVAEDAILGDYVVSATHGTWTLTRTVPVAASALVSPAIEADGSITFVNASHPGDTLYLVGQMNGWNEQTALPFQKQDGVFRLNLKLAPGKYEYKFLPTLGSWAGDFTDPLNPRTAGGNSLAIVPGLLFESATDVAVGSSLELKASLLSPAGEKTEAAPVWSLKEPVEGVTLTGNRLTVSSEAVVKTIVVQAEFAGYRLERTLTVVSTMNRYTLHYYRPDGKAGDWNLWLYPPGKEGKGYSFTKVDEDGFATGTYSFPDAKLNVIPRLSVEGNDWSAQDSTRLVESKSGQATEAWIVQGKEEVYYSKPDVTNSKPDRYIKFTYTKPDGDFKGWNLWVWNTGISDGEVSFTSISRTNAVAIIPISKSTAKIGFKVRKGIDWQVVDQDYDREIITGTNPVTKVGVTAGQGTIRTYPPLTAPLLADGGATFYYRDNELFAEDQMNRISAVTLQIAGVDYPMTYSAEEERFTYTLEKLTPGRHLYSYRVTKDGVTTEVSDPMNTVNGESVIEYALPSFELTASVAPGAINSNENAVLALRLEGEAADVRSLSADLTALGGKVDTSIDASLLALTLAVKDSVTAGVKSIPLTLTDRFGNKHRFETSVTVKTRQQENTNDFDWDEARIYFLLTDRFFNGNPANDDPNGEGYDKTHLESYHGGDWQGITQKLDYLVDLGINTIWISPIVDNIDFNKGLDFGGDQYAYHGYWAKNFTETEEHFGDIRDFQTLLDGAHSRGIKVMVDVVLNHTGYGMDVPDSKGIRHYPTDEERKVFDGMLRSEDEDGVIRNRLAGLPDLRTEDPAVRDKIIQWQTDWIEKTRTELGNTIDYFRVDTVKHVDNTTWMSFKNRLTELEPSFKLIGENFGASIDNDGGYLKSGMMDSQLDFRFKGVASDLVNGKISSVERELAARNETLDNTATMGQFLSSHDEDNFLIKLLSESDRVKFKNGTMDEETLHSVQGKQMLAAALQITAKGQPVIYYGEEIGQSGMNAGDMSKGQFSENRYDFDWSRLTEETYLTLHDHYKKLLNIRKENSLVFSKGTRTQVVGSDDEGYDVFARSYKGQTLYVGLNIKEAEQTVSVPTGGTGAWKDLYSGTIYQTDGEGRLTVKLPSSLKGGTVVLAAEKSSEPGSGSGYGVFVPPTTQLRVTPIVSESGGKQVEITESELTAAFTLAASKADKTVELSLSGIAAGERVKVLLPSQALVSDAARKGSLRIAAGELTITIPGGAWPTAGQAGGGRFVLEIGTAVDSETTAVSNRIQGVDAGYRSAGSLFHLSVTTSDGKPVAFREKLEWSRALSERELAMLSEPSKAGAYGIGTEGQPSYLGGRLSEGRFLFKSLELGDFLILQYNKSFRDVPGGWSKAYIEVLAAKHIARGIGEDVFRPQGIVTRAELAAFLGRTLGFSTAADFDTTEPGEGGFFPDIPAASYYADYAAALGQAGILTGYDDGSFRPNEAITREQLAVLLDRAYRYAAANSEQDVSISQASSPTAFTDLSEASPYAAESIRAVQALGLMEGDGHGRFQPKATATREQLAKVLVLLLEKLEQ
ncbi:alpha-amylase family glycosyl hydrolase [Gorillibacterium sp. CAU 1737]|uniref:alpha-amylase family glycosyl hydrolase n=1 Tax=Gorillibacterium sp. CAU 1737 TaxID=3140362 RepID=UPI003260A9D5